VQLRHIRVQVQAQWWNAGQTAFGDRDHHKGRVASLKLEQDYFTTLEQLQVWHRLDETSPLWRMRDSLAQHLDGVEVSVSAFDTASLQNVMMFYRYERGDLVLNAVFENTLSPSGNPREHNQLQADHSKLDRFQAEEENMRHQVQRKRKSSVTKAAIRSAMNNLALSESSIIRGRKRSLSENSMKVPRDLALANWEADHSPEREPTLERRQPKVKWAIRRASSMATGAVAQGGGAIRRASRAARNSHERSTSPTQGLSSRSARNSHERPTSPTHSVPRACPPSDALGSMEA